MIDGYRYHGPYPASNLFVSQPITKDSYLSSGILGFGVYALNLTELPENGSGMRDACEVIP